MSSGSRKRSSRPAEKGPSKLEMHHWPTSIETMDFFLFSLSLSLHIYFFKNNIYIYVSISISISISIYLSIHPSIHPSIYHLYVSNMLYNRHTQELWEPPHVCEYQNFPAWSQMHCIFKINDPRILLAPDSLHWFGFTLKICSKSMGDHDFHTQKGWTNSGSIGTPQLGIAGSWPNPLVHCFYFQPVWAEGTLYRKNSQTWN